MTAYLLVRAEVEKNSREGFDRWYQNEHLPSALKEFKDSIGAWRAWSDVEEGVHLAFYEFENIQDAHNLLSSDLMKEFIKEFDSHWDGKVTRSRDVFFVKQHLKKT
tara:strand:- start:17828 stop:18145 length:318 start_codon:yes stop_codon:yes gene_type:complete